MEEEKEEEKDWTGQKTILTATSFGYGFDYIYVYCYCSFMTCLVEIKTFGKFLPYCYHYFHIWLSFGTVMKIHSLKKWLG